jgi:hypothetical protein
VPTGVVADLYSRTLSLVVAALLSGVAMIGIGALPEVGWILAAMVLWGLAWTFRSGAEVCALGFALAGSVLLAGGASPQRRAGAGGGAPVGSWGDEHPRREEPALVPGRPTPRPAPAGAHLGA